MKYDADKPPVHLIPPEALLEIAKILAFGAEKYGENNWRKDIDNTSYSRTYASIQRHLLAWFAGQDLDPESGESHISHAATQILILIMQIKYGIEETDDRWKDIYDA